jgi:hypothetical protein
VDWKRTRIVTILKPGKDPALADFYRPISLILSCVRKLFERMLLLRLELWAEGSGILSGTQFGFTTVKVPVPLVLLLWDMMCEKHLYFFDGQDVAFMRTGFKGLPQGSVLSPFM